MIRKKNEASNLIGRKMGVGEEKRNKKNRKMNQPE